MPQPDNNATEEFLAVSALESVMSRIAILDPNGRVLFTNAAWRDFAKLGGGAKISSGIGTNFLAMCDDVCQTGDENIGLAAAGIRTVLSGEKDFFESVHLYHSAVENYWCFITVSRLTGEEFWSGAVVLSYNDMSMPKCNVELDNDVRQDAEDLATADNSKLHVITKIAEYLPGRVGYWDKNLRCKFANNAYLEWSGKSFEDMAQTSIKDSMEAKLFEKNTPFILRALAGEKVNFEQALTKPDGSIVCMMATYIPDINPDATVDGFFILVSDVTAMRKIQFGLQLAETVYKNTLEGIFVTDLVGTILSVNPAFTKITGYTSEDAVGRNSRFLESRQHDPTFYSAIWHEVLTVGQWKGEIWNRRKNGELYLECHQIKCLPGRDEKSTRYLSVFTDATESWHKSEKIKHLAFYDLLTNLPNRALLLDRLEQNINLAKREKRGLILMFLDLDGFKKVNDEFGHDIGDELLRVVTLKLLTQLRDSDTLARFGGDEFVILLGESANNESVESIAQRIIAAVDVAVELRTNTVRVGISIGVARYPVDGITPVELLKKADTAMYQAKKSGKNAFRCSSTEVLPSSPLADSWSGDRTKL